MNRRQLLKTLAAFSFVGVTNGVSSLAIGSHSSAPASRREELLLAALMDTRTQCITLLATPELSDSSASELTSAVEELRCLTDHAIGVCRSASQQSPAFLQASSDSIGRVCRFLSHANVQHKIDGNTLADALATMQRTSNLLTHAILA